MLLLPEAVEALRALSVDRGFSRDNAIRNLLDEYISIQDQLAHGDRLTHATAVLRYPPLPPGRYLPDGKTRVPLRLPPGSADKLASLSLRLPGQPKWRGLKDYARSPLADALTTAIARQKPFDVPGLEGIPLIWTHAAADGLWRLTIAATLTAPEQRAVLGDLDELDAEGENPSALAKLLRDGDLAWHHPWRNEVALHLARNLQLAGPNADAGWSSLEQRDDAFEDLRFDLERTEELDHRLLHGAPKHANINLTGRGGSLVWRARRRLALQGIRQWISSEPTAPLVVSPPRVKIIHPSAWTAIRVETGQQPPTKVLADIESGRVLTFATDDHTAAWPYLRATGEPVPAFDVAIRALGQRRPEEVAELVLLDDPRLAVVYLHAAVAHDLGFITASERDERVEEAAKTTTTRIEETLKRAERWVPADYAELVARKKDPESFFKLAAEHHIEQAVAHPWWEWNAGPTAEELEKLSGSPARLTQLLEARGRYWKRQLEASMEMAGRTAIARGSADTEETDDEDDWGDETEFDLDDLLA